MTEDAQEASKSKGIKFCPRCALENIKTRLNVLGNNILRCERCKWIGQKISSKLTESFTCPKCALEGIKSELKNYPNHVLTCRNCQWVGKKVSETLLQALI